MPSARSLTERLRHLAPEALAFATIGGANTVLYVLITYLALPIGAVKASVLGTVITTTLAYFGNRYWTYRHHPRRTLRREYTLFFGFNLVGMVIQSGAVAIGKYGFGLSETHDKLTIMGVTVVGIGVATIFRFWAYRTFVFLKAQRIDEEHAAPLAVLDPAAALAELSTEPDAEVGTGSEPAVTAELDAEIDAQIEAEIEAEIDSEIEAEIEAARRHANR